MTIDDSPLGTFLRQHRAAAGLTQEELADRAGISARTISDVERGLRTTIYRETARCLTEALGLEEPERSNFEEVARGRNSRTRLEGSWMSAEGPLSGASLPSRPTRLIGRERELEIALAALTDPEVRLLTLSGPGGIGKTRLAAEAANRAQAHFSDGVFFVSLAATREPGTVLTVVAHALRVKGPHEPLIEALAHRLSGKRSLLVLDTFEQLLDAGPMIADLVAASPGLTVLVTSREVLHLRAERELVVPTLELPADEPGVRVDVSRYPALAMFVERARAVKPDLVVDEDAADIVAEICRSVNGVPLAIELAAARVKHLALPALRDHLEHRLSVLTGGPRDLPRRQQTMRDTVAWSYDLLASAERSLFRMLSVFAGGWTLQAAASICIPDEGELLARMSALVDKSLVLLTDTHRAEPRYRMLDVIWEYAAEQRDASGKSDGLARRHADYYLAMAEAGEPELGRRAQETWLEVLDAEHDNFQAALRWSIQRRDADLALRFAGALWRSWLSQGYNSEGQMWLRKALAVEPPGPAGARMKALWGAAWLSYHQGDYGEMEELSVELLPLARAEGEPIDMRNALTVRGMVAMARGRYAEALVPLQEALYICRGLEPSWLLATSLLNLGMASLHAGASSAARDLLEEARAVYDQLGDRRFAARTIQQIGYLALVQEERDEARSLVATSLERYRDLGDLWGLVESLEGLSACSAADGMAQRAGCIGGAAEVLRERLATRPLPFDRALTERYVTPVRASVEDSVWKAAWEKGRRMSLDDAIDYSLMPQD